MRRRPLSLRVLLPLLGVGAAALAATTYDEAHPIAAIRFLTGDQLAGNGWKVAEMVDNDGFFNTYTVYSDTFGSFQGQGPIGLAARMREIAALVELDRVSRSKVFAEAAKKSAIAQPDTVEAMSRQQRPRPVPAPNPAGWMASAAAPATPSAAAPAISATEMPWYAKMGVDPYTDNQLLRDVIASYARIEGLASFGMRMAGLPPVPGGDALRPALERVWSTDPQALRDANFKLLAAAGVSEAQAAAFVSNPALTPTQQTAIALAVDQLAGVEGRQNLVASAAAVTSREDAIDMLRATLMLIDLHHKSPLAAVLAGSRLPVARTADGALVAALPADTGIWSLRIATAAGEFALRYQREPVTRRDFYLLGEASPRFVEGMQKLGWKVRERWRLAPGM